MDSSPLNGIVMCRSGGRNDHLNEEGGVQYEQYNNRFRHCKVPAVKHQGVTDYRRKHPTLGMRQIVAPDLSRSSAHAGGEPMRIFAFVTDAASMQQLLGYPGEPTQAPRIAPAARGPSRWEEDFDPREGTEGTHLSQPLPEFELA